MSKVELNTIHRLSFGAALVFVQRGNGVVMQRSGWNGKGMFVGVQPFGAAGMMVPTLAIHAADGLVYPWVPSQQDMFTEDWELFRLREESAVCDD